MKPKGRLLTDAHCSSKNTMVKEFDRQTYTTTLSRMGGFVAHKWKVGSPGHPPCLHPSILRSLSIRSRHHGALTASAAQSLHEYLMRK